MTEGKKHTLVRQRARLMFEALGYEVTDMGHHGQTPIYDMLVERDGRKIMVEISTSKSPGEISSQLKMYRDFYKFPMISILPMRHIKFMMSFHMRKVVFLPVEMFL